MRREGEFAEFEIASERLADQSLLADQVEQVVLNLEGCAKVHAVAIQGIGDALRSAREHRAEFTGHGD